MNMCTCENCPNATDTSNVVSFDGTVQHTNAFVILNGIPYLLAEYVDNNLLQQVDPSVIKSQIFIDATEATRPIIDLTIDDIGKTSTGEINSIGNNTQQMSLVELIKSNKMMLDHKLPVLKKSLVLRVNYQLENRRTGQILRSMVEDLRIDDRNYYVAINPKNINDNSIITNFAATLVSTINQFTYGTEPMMFRITSVQMCYECVRPNAVEPLVKNIPVCKPTEIYQSFYDPTDYIYNAAYGLESQMWQYHQQMEKKFIFGSPRCYGHEDINMYLPNTWSMFSRFYHFDNGGRDVVLHMDEINASYNRTILLGCGTIQVNRTFLVNPGCRIIFKFSIWKNDAVLVNDSTVVCDTLQACLGSPYYPVNCGCKVPETPATNNCNCQNVPTSSDYQQNMIINNLTAQIFELTKAVKELKGETTEGLEPGSTLPEEPTTIVEPSCTCNSDQLAQLTAMVQALQTQINELKDNKQEDPNNIVPIPENDIVDAVENAGSNT